MGRYPYREILRAAYTLGLQPSEARGMSPKQLGEWINANRPEQHYGSMSETQARELTDWINENPEEFA